MIDWQRVRGWERNDVIQADAAMLLYIGVAQLFDMLRRGIHGCMQVPVGYPKVTGSFDVMFLSMLNDMVG